MIGSFNFAQDTYGYPPAPCTVLLANFGFNVLTEYGTTGSGHRYVKETSEFPQDPKTKEVAKIITINYSRSTNKESGQADELFHDLQWEALKIQDSCLALQRPKAKKNDLGHRSRHLSFENSSQTDDASPYDYGSANAKASLDNACEPVKKVMAILNREGHTHSTIPFEEGNQALTVFYLNEMAMNWPTDGSRRCIGPVHLSDSTGDTGQLDV